MTRLSKLPNGEILASYPDPLLSYATKIKATDSGFPDNSDCSPERVL